jgi:hypothetical protein
MWLLNPDVENHQVIPFQSEIKLYNEERMKLLICTPPNI